MWRSGRIAIVSLFAIFLLLLYRQTWFPQPLEDPSYPASGRTAKNGHDATPDAVGSDVELVVASMRKENTAWLEDYLVDWKKSIYVVDDENAALRVPKNKGREAMVFLT